MEKVILLQKILNYLTRLNELIVTSSKAGDTSISKISEGLVRELFNLVYEDYNLTNCNLNISNYPAIDLHNIDKRICFQVTSNKDVKKIQETVDKFFNKKLNEKYDKLYFIVLANKAYDIVSLDKAYKKILSKYDTNYEIDFTETIIDLAALYNIISYSCSTEAIIKIKDLLEKNFDLVKGATDLHPYYDQLKNKFFEVVMDDETGLTLNSIYMEPDFLIHHSSIVKNSDIYTNLGNNYSELKNSFSIHDFFNSRLQGQVIYNNLCNKPASNLTFVTGYPGQGKTSFCHRILFDLITSPIKKNIFYFKLRNVTETKKLINNPFSIIHEELESEIEGLSKSLVKNSITILDGLDELYMKDSLTSDDIELFCKAIIRECDKFKTWDVIITTRHGYINFDKLYKEDYIAIALKPFNVTKQIKWLENYRMFHPKTWLTTEKLKSFNSQYYQNEGYIGELLNQPLLLYIVASLNNEITVSTDRSDIYNKLFDQIIERKYNKDGQIDNLKKIKEEDLRNLLQEIAFEIHNTGKGFITTKELLKNPEIKEYTSKIGNNNLVGTLKGILISFYFKERTESYRNAEDAGIEFFHKSLQEYLTAEKIIALLMSEILNKDIKGKYILKNESDFLILLNKVFSQHPISNEIWFFLSKLTGKIDFETRKIIGERLLEHIDYFFEKDFLYKYEGQEQNPINKIHLTSSSYWSLLHNLEIRENFIKNKVIGNKIISYYKGSKNNDYWPENIELSYQKAYDLNFSGITFFGTEINHASFNKCAFQSFSTYDVSLGNVTFFMCDFTENGFWSGQMKRILFEKCGVYDMKLNVDSCKEVIFKNCDIDGNVFFIHDKIKRKTIKFENCVFAEKICDSIMLLRDKFTFSNCKIQKFKSIGKKGGAIGYHVDF